MRQKGITMNEKFQFMNDFEKGEAGIVDEGDYVFGRVISCKLNHSQTKLVMVIEGEGNRYYYTLNTNPLWGSYFQRFCEKNELIDSYCTLEPEKMEGKYVFFPVYTKQNGDTGVRWIEDADEDLIDSYVLRKKE